MPDLVTLDEYEARFAQNSSFSTDNGETVQHFPCPFCAARDWFVCPLTEFGNDTQPHYCTECDRSSRLVFTRSGNSTEMDVVQCSGPDAPPWLTKRPRRDDVDESVKAKGRIDPSRKKTPAIKKRKPRQSLGSKSGQLKPTGRSRKGQL